LFFDVDLFGLDTELDGVVVDTFLNLVGAFLFIPVDHMGPQVVLFGGFGLDGEDAFSKGYNGLTKGRVELQVQPVVAAHVQECFSVDEFPLSA